METQQLNNPGPQVSAANDAETDWALINRVELAVNAWRDSSSLEQNVKMPAWWELINPAPAAIPEDVRVLAALSWPASSGDILNEEPRPDVMDVLALTRNV